MTPDRHVTRFVDTSNHALQKDRLDLRTTFPLEPIPAKDDDGVSAEQREEQRANARFGGYRAVATGPVVVAGFVA